MKKALVIVAAVAMVASFASCKKTCTCKSYLDGDVVGTTEYTLNNGEKCSDYAASAIIDGPMGKTGVECK